MAVDFDAKLASLAAEIVRDAVQDYDRCDMERGPIAACDTSMFPGGWQVTGSFPAITGSFPATRGPLGSDGGVSLKKVFWLPGMLPAIRLPAASRLAMRARSAPLMMKLEALAEWLGRGGRLLTETDELFDADAAEAAHWIGVPCGYLPYLWEYALTTGWFELNDEPDGSRTWAVLGQTAWRWADRDDSGALHVWSVVFAAVLAQALDVAASWDPESARKLNLQGQGVVAAIMLFLARRAGLSLAEVTELVINGAMGHRASARARRTWDRWVRKHGDPTRLLLDELAELHAVMLSESDPYVVEPTPLALWALREQVQRDGVLVPLLPAIVAQMDAAELVAMAGGVSEAEFEAESAAWVRGRGPDQAARELLEFATFSRAQPRLVAVNLTRRIGLDAYRAWRDAMQRPELRGYARIALSVLAAELPESTMPLALNPDPDDLTWVTTDLLALACGDEDPDPRHLAAQFREAIPQGEEPWIFDLMSRSSHPQVAQVLTVLGRHHPDRRVARDARRAARTASRNPPAARAGGVPIGAAGR
jgi:hypothetical protein